MPKRSPSIFDQSALARRVLKVLPDAIPSRLKKRHQWVLWRLVPPEQAADAPRKMPFRLQGKPAKSNDPATWATFEETLEVYRASRKQSATGVPYSGVGYVFTKKDDIVGIDLDNCRDSSTGKLEPWAVKIIKRFASYSEVSPSGTGVKIWCRGRLPIDGTGRRSRYSSGAVEMYQHGRYFCVTGRRLEKSTAKIADAQEVIDWLWGEAFAKSKSESGNERKGRNSSSCGMDQSEVIERAKLYLDEMPPAVSGQGGHNATFRAACVLVQGFDLSPETAYPLMVEYSQRCEPPWTEKEIRHKLEDADRFEGERGSLLNARQSLQRENQALTLIDLATDWEFWHTPDDEAYVTIPVGKHREHQPVRSPAVKRWLTKAYYEATAKAASKEAISNALNLFEARAIHNGEEHPIFVRIAQQGRCVYVDLCDAEWRAVEITRRGWSVVDNPSVRFRRSRGMLPLPEPERGGTVEDLRPFINVDDACWPLVVAWLVSAFRATGPYPVLALFATQGAGKSNAGRFLRSLIDPNSAPLRSEPRELRDLMLSANHNWCLAFDNLSHLPPWLSDAFCRLSTGGGFATRQLYTDADEVIFDAVRPIILTSIVEVAERGDLLDRCLPVTLPPITEDRRRDEQSLLAEFDKARPKVLGALLNAVAGALREFPNVKLKRLPRMADFAKWATAAEPALGWKSGRFMKAYDRNREDANKLALEASPIASKLFELLEHQGDWQGTASQLLDALEKMFDELDRRRPQGWPRGPRSMAGHLRRLAPNLDAAGWSVDFRQGRERVISITQAAVGAVASFASQPSRDPDKRGSGGECANASVDGRNRNRRQSKAKKTGPFDANYGSNANAGDKSASRKPEKARGLTRAQKREVRSRSCLRSGRRRKKRKK